MEFLGENGLKELCELIKEEADKKIDATQLSSGKAGQFLISDGNGGISFLTIENAEGSKF